MRMLTALFMGVLTATVAGCGMPPPAETMVMTMQFPLLTQSAVRDVVSFKPDSLSLPSDCTPFMSIALMNATTRKPLGGTEGHNPQPYASATARVGTGWSVSANGQTWIYRSPQGAKDADAAVYIRLECNTQTFVRSQTFNLFDRGSGS